MEICIPKMPIIGINEMKEKKSPPEINVLVGSIESELDNRRQLLELMQSNPIPESEVLMNLGLFLKRQDLSRILFMNELYQKQLEIHGSIFEFGVRWGQNLALFETMRGIYEPFNYNRKIVGFDTFEGFPSVDEKDGTNPIIKKGSYNVVNGYEHYLAQILQCLENENPIAHIKTTHLVKGDATKTIKIYLKEHPETIISMAYFDFDIYTPTKECLLAIKPHLAKGAVIGFDELNFQAFPGETLALQEVFGLGAYKIQRSPFGVLQSYLIFE